MIEKYLDEKVLLTFILNKNGKEKIVKRNITGLEVFKIFLDDYNFKLDDEIEILNLETNEYIIDFKDKEYYNDEYLYAETLLEHIQYFNKEEILDIQNEVANNFREEIENNEKSIIEKEILEEYKKEYEDKQKEKDKYKIKYDFLKILKANLKKTIDDTF